MEDLENIKFSQLRNLFYETLRAIFASEIDTEEDAIFVKQLIDYILRVVDDCRIKGLEEKMIPIFYTSLWQGATPTNRGIFSKRTQVGINLNEDNNIHELVIKVQNAIKEWGDETLGGLIQLSEDEAVYIGDDDETD